MEPVDGNAIGGLLLSVFGADLTGVPGTCAHCGDSAPLAACVVYLGGPGIVARCRACDGQLMVLVERRGVTCVDLLGIR